MDILEARVEGELGSSSASLIFVRKRENKQSCFNSNDESCNGTFSCSRDNYSLPGHAETQGKET